MIEVKIIKGFRLTSPYGYRTHPVTGEKNSFHNGIDFVGNGTRLLAIAPGRIIESDFDEISGNFIKVEYIINGVKYLFSYCHLKNKVVKEPHEYIAVEKGEWIAVMGKSGRSTAVHCHLTVRELKTGEIIDPLTAFKFI